MSIRLENISKYYGQQAVVNNLSLEIQNGEFFVLLGSSGSGKTTVLNLIAGLTELDRGQIYLNGREVTSFPPQNRNIGFVFQNYALFQYMTVAENIEFGLRVRKTNRAVSRKKRDELLELVGLVGLGERMPRQLSGGQQQRVALARALALEPDVLLLDEPLGALDAKIRTELRRSLKSIQRQLNVAAILVTHDQDEAFDLGDRVGVMSFGRLIEVGTPLELYQRPKTEFVASFLGTPNILLGEVLDNKVHIGQNTFAIPSETVGFNPDSRVQILFRPEDIAVAKNPKDLNCPPLGQGRVLEKGFNGPNERLRLELPQIPGVRSIAPKVPYGHPGIILEAARPIELNDKFPIAAGDTIHVGIHKLHPLSHPGLNLLALTNGTADSNPAIQIGGYLSKIAHARLTIFAHGNPKEHLEEHLEEAKKQVGSGMAALQTYSSEESYLQALQSSGEKEGPFDLVILSWPSTADLESAVQALEAGNHNVLLAVQPDLRIRKALICVASGEPGKDDVLFAGRLLRHVGASVTLLTVCPSNSNPEQITRSERYLTGGKQSLARFGIESTPALRQGDPLQCAISELSNAEYDLVVMGAPLPDPLGQISLDGFVSSILRTVRNCSFLIVRSHITERE